MEKPLLVVINGRHGSGDFSWGLGITRQVTSMNCVYYAELEPFSKITSIRRISK